MKENAIKNLMKSYIEKKIDSIFYITVRVIPNAPRSEIVELMENDVWKIRVRALPVKGKANKELEMFLKKSFSLKSAKVSSGDKVRTKLVCLEK